MNWIHSGKVSGRGFSIRHVKHKKQANCKRATVSITKASSSRKGFFENLKQYVAVGYDTKFIINLKH